MGSDLESALYIIWTVDEQVEHYSLYIPYNLVKKVLGAKLM